MTGRRIPRWARVGLIVVLALTALFYTAGGIVFSNMIHSDALTPLPPTSDNGVFVIALGEDTITLSSIESRSDTTLPGLIGLDWEDGYGRIGEIRSVDGLSITREFEVVSGSPPPVCMGDLTYCDEVDIEGWTFENDPADVGLAFTEVGFEGPLGELGAWQVDGGDGSAWVIHTHGWRASRREAIRALPTYHTAGFTSFVIDYRNDPGAPADPSGIYRFGRTEWEDVEAAVRYSLDSGASSIVLHGYSSGSTANLAFLENSALADHVVASVHDSPNIDMAETVRHGASKRTIPGTPLPIPRSLIAVAMFIADIRWDVGWGEIDYADRGDRIVSIPTLVFHGVQDDRVPIEMSREFRDSAPDWIHLIESEQAGHVTSWNVDRASYEEALRSFLEELDTT